MCYMCRKDEKEALRTPIPQLLTPLQAKVMVGKGKEELEVHMRVSPSPMGLGSRAGYVEAGATWEGGPGKLKAKRPPHSPCEGLGGAAVGGGGQRGEEPVSLPGNPFLLGAPLSSSCSPGHKAMVSLDQVSQVTSHSLHSPTCLFWQDWQAGKESTEASLLELGPWREPVLQSHPLCVQNSHACIP